MLQKDFLLLGKEAAIFRTFVRWGENSVLALFFLPGWQHGLLDRVEHGEQPVPLLPPQKVVAHHVVLV